MSSEDNYDSAIRAALRADAEAAQAEIRAAGIICPSCGTNMADLPDGHMLAISDLPGTGMLAECRDGAPVTLLTTALSPMSEEQYATFEAVAQIALHDGFRRLDAEAFKAVTGEGPAGFTGVLPVLEQP